jgi:hypothetical protein
MSLKVRNVEYFYVRIQDASRKAYELLAHLALEEVNLLAFSAVPYGPNHVELTVFPDKPEAFASAAKNLGWTVTGPQHACLVQVDDHLGALAEIHQYSSVPGSTFMLRVVSLTAPDILVM